MPRGAWIGLWTAVAVGILTAVSVARGEDMAGDMPVVPAADMTVVTPPGQMTEAVRAFFPEAYSQFMTVSYERQDAGTGRKPEIWPQRVEFLVPAAAFDATIEDVLEPRVRAFVKRVLRPNDAHCESWNVGDVEEYGWMAWEDKTVRRITIHFHVAC